MNIIHAIADLPEYKGKAWRAGDWDVPRNASALNIINNEIANGNAHEYQHLSKTILQDLNTYPAKALIWVTTTKNAARHYGHPENITLPAGSKILATDGEDGYLVLRGNMRRITEFKRLSRGNGRLLIKSLAKDYQLNISKYDVNQLIIGYNVELEHDTGDNKDMIKTAADPLKIAMAHLDEMPDYYTRLAKMEKSTGSGHKWDTEERTSPPDPNSYKRYGTNEHTMTSMLKLIKDLTENIDANRFKSVAIGGRIQFNAENISDAEFKFSISSVDYDHMYFLLSAIKEDRHSIYYRITLSGDKFLLKFWEDKGGPQNAGLTEGWQIVSFLARFVPTVKQAFHEKFIELELDFDKKKTKPRPEAEKPTSNEPLTKQQITKTLRDSSFVDPPFMAQGQVMGDRLAWGLIDGTSGNMAFYVEFYKSDFGGGYSFTFNSDNIETIQKLFRTTLKLEKADCMDGETFMNGLPKFAKLIQSKLPAIARGVGKSRGGDPELIPAR